MKRILSLIIILSLCIGTVTAAYSSMYDGVSYTYDDLDTLSELMGIQERIMNNAHDRAEIARQINDYIGEMGAKEQWEEANGRWLAYNRVRINLIEHHWQEKREEYPVATYIWEYLKALGYNDQVTAGILGNIMAETGGQTLNIQWWLGGRGYYGMCQWSRTYCREVYGASLEQQCDYLRDTMAYQINYAGFCYCRGFNYDSFIRMTSVEEAALAFAKTYERCGSGSYRQRQRNAIKAYEYFTT